MINSLEYEYIIISLYCSKIYKFCLCYCVKILLNDIPVIDVNGKELLNNAIYYQSRGQDKTRQYKTRQDKKFILGFKKNMQNARSTPDITYNTF